MASTSRFRNTQKRKKWAETGVRFSLEYTKLIEPLEDAGGPEGADALARALRSFCDLGSTYAELEDIKTLSSAFHKALATARAHDDAQALAAPLVGLLFERNSKPLHRALLQQALLPKLRDADAQERAEAAIGAAVRAVASSHARRAAHALSAGAVAPGTLLVEPQASLASSHLKAHLAPVATDLALYFAAAVDAGVRAGPEGVVARAAAGGGGGPSPWIEDLQECLSTAYYLVQAHGETMCADRDGARAVAAAARTALAVLQRTVLPQESCLTASALLWGAAALPQLPPARTARLLASALLPQLLGGDDASPEPDSIVDAALRGDGTSLAAEFARVGPVGMACAVRGAVTSLPAAVVTSPVDAGGREGVLGPTLIVRWAACAREAEEAQVKYHAVATLQAVIAQARKVAGARGGVPALDESGVDTVLGAMWAAFEDPLMGPSKNAQLAFEDFVDLLDATAPSSCATGSWGLRIAEHLTSLDEGGARCGKRGFGGPIGARARCWPLKSLCEKCGATTVLELKPALYRDTVAAMVDNSTATPASNLLGSLLSGSIAGSLASCADAAVDAPARRAAVEGWSRAWRPHVVAALLGDDARFRINVAQYALPQIFRLKDGPTILALLLRDLVRDARAADGRASDETVVGAVMSALRIARREGLVSSLEEVVGPGKPLPEGVMVSALCHRSEDLRISATELLAVHAKPAELPSALELSLLRRGVAAALRSPATSARNRWLPLIGNKLLPRIQVAAQGALGRAAREERAWRKKAKAPPDAQPELTAPTVALLAGVGECEGFVQWLAAASLTSLYPSAPYTRRIVAIEVLRAILDLWPPQGAPPTKISEASARGAKITASAAAGARAFQALPQGALEPATCRALLGGLTDSWDRFRDCSLAVLSRLPRPLPGLGAGGGATRTARWACTLLRSPRAKDGDAGARVLRLLYLCYARGLGWDMRAGADPATQQCEPPPPEEQATTRAKRDTLGLSQADPLRAQLAALSSMVGGLEADVARAEDDLYAACSACLAHGSLLALRYCVEETDWVAAGKAAGPVRADWRALVVRMMDAIRGALRVALPPTAEVKKYNIDAGEVQQGAGGGDDDGSDVEMDGDGDGDGGGGGVASLGPRAQVMVIGSWLTIKEAALLVAEVARQLPAPEDRTIDPPGEGGSEPQRKRPAAPDDLLPAEVLLSVGEMLMHTMRESKHRGALEKTGLALQVVATSLRRSRSPALSRVPDEWERATLAHIRRPGQGLDDVTRRSAGLPYAALALVRSEPPGVPRAALPRCVEALLGVAEDDGSGSAAGAWPRIHAFNCLREIFQCASITADTAAYHSRALATSIRALAAPQWEVRNAASLSFTALAIKILGFRNNASDLASQRGPGYIYGAEVATGGGRRTLTAAEFFARYPSLHGFMLGELRAAAAWSGGGALSVHPSLFPVLAVLSRLRPSHASTAPAPGGSAVTADLRAFRETLLRCAARARHAHVRRLAAMAIAALVGRKDLRATTEEAAAALAPGAPNGLNAAHAALMILDCLCADIDAAGAASVIDVLRPVLLRAPSGQNAWVLDPRSAPPLLVAAGLRVLRSLAGAVARDPDGAPDGLEGACLDVADAARAAVHTLLAHEARRVQSAVRAGDTAPERQPADGAAVGAGLMVREAAELYLGPELRLMLLRCSRPSNAAHYWPVDASEVVFVATSVPVPQDAQAGALSAVLRTLAAPEARDPSLPLVRSAADLSRYLRTLVTDQSHYEVAGLAIEVGEALRTLPCAARPHEEEAAAAWAQRLGALASGPAGQHLCVGAPALIARASAIAASATVRGWDVAATTQCVARLERTSRPSESAQDREGAAAELRALALLSALFRPGREHLQLRVLALRAWGVALRLLEDDDEAVRMIAAEAVGRALEASSGQEAAPFDALAEAAGTTGAAATRDAHPEALLRSAVARVVAAALDLGTPAREIVHAWAHRQLRGAFVAGVEQADLDGDAAAAAGEEGGLPAWAVQALGASEALVAEAFPEESRVFDRELDNQHQECLLFSVLVDAAVEAARSGRRSQDVAVHCSREALRSGPRGCLSMVRHVEDALRGDAAYVQGGAGVAVAQGSCGAAVFSRAMAAVRDLRLARRLGAWSPGDGDVGDRIGQLVAVAADVECHPLLAAALRDLVAVEPGQGAHWAACGLELLL
ncbi:unnamed protein product [Pedinophyceae sp. YPF-701]|nr:unnamed protein product [Pedinophyceae sp. YPF-701]